MKKNLLLIIGFVSLMGLFSLQTYAQIGSVCDSAHAVTTLPFSAIGLSTATSGNNYNTLPCGGTIPNFMSGNDYVFSYTPLYNLDISVTLANTSKAVGVFITSDCPDSATGCIASNTALMGNPAIPSASLTAGTTYYIIVSSVSFMAASTAFDIQIKELFAFDAAVTKFITPESNCNLSSAEEVKVMIKNYGTQSISNLNVGYSINGTPITPVTITGPINAGDSLEYPFVQTADLSNAGSYQFKAYVLLVGDEFTSNDTISKTVAHQAYVNTLPYIQDFESGDGGWTTGGTNASWALGTPNATVINTPAPGGQNSWVTNLTGDHNLQENSYVIGPCFDFTNYPNVSMKLDVWYQTSPAFDGARVEASIDGGASWFVVGGNNEPSNWYNAMMTDTVWTGSSNGWKTAQHPLSFLGGKNNVRIKIIYKTGMMSFQTAEGFGFDNILIYECDSMPTAAYTHVVNGNSVVFTNTSTNATGYLWDFDEQLTVNADTNTNTAHTFTVPGTYNVTLSSFNECGVSTFSQSITITSTVGIEDLNSDELNIYPNPANDIINISLSNNQEKIQKIQISNVLGQVVFNSIDNEKSINVSNFNKGLYYVTVTTSDKVISKKITIEN